MATNQNFLLVAIRHGYQQKKIQLVAMSYGKAYIFSKKRRISFLPLEKSSTELLLEVKYLMLLSAHVKRFSVSHMQAFREMTLRVKQSWRH